MADGSIIIYEVTLAGSVSPMGQKLAVFGVSRADCRQAVRHRKNCGQALREIGYDDDVVRFENCLGLTTEAKQAENAAAREQREATLEQALLIR